MASFKNTKEMMKVSALDQISRLKEFVNFIDDESNDIVDISFEVDRITREEGALKFLLDKCDEY